ncbi:MAG TPA: hypothetical protein ENG00_01065 [Candidatus Aenigmarchaeota archaeon]|nr:hypothetical protein [Candidatus Aenigmarchaeota archaeon]
MMNDDISFSELLKKIDREREILYLDEGYAEDYLHKLMRCLHEFKRELRLEKAEWFSREEQREISGIIESLYNLLSFWRENPTNRFEIDMDSGFPSWASIHEIYSFPEDSTLYGNSYEEKIIENARYRLLMGMDVEANASGMRLIKFRSEIKSTKLPALREPKLLGKSKITFLDYNPVRNHPIYWSIQLDEKNEKNLRPKSVDEFFRRLLFGKNYALKFGRRGRVEVHPSFKKSVGENAYLGAKPMYFLLNIEFPDVVERIESLYIGPFYFSPEQNLDSPSEVLGFDLRDFLRKHKDSGILVTQYECVQKHPGKTREVYGIKLYPTPETGMITCQENP